MINSVIVVHAQVSSGLSNFFLLLVRVGLHLALSHRVAGPFAMSDLALHCLLVELTRDGYTGAVVLPSGQLLLQPAPSPSALDLLSVLSAPSPSRPGHCEHCHGFMAQCGCKYGCRRPGSAQCFGQCCDKEGSRSVIPSTPRGWHQRSGKTITMYHGTTKERARQILKDGAFKQSDSGMLGRGVYLSDDIEKAKRYGDAIFTVEVKVGRVRKIDSQSHPRRTDWNSHGNNSAWVLRNCGMVDSGLPETCVFNPRRLRIISMRC